jgi:predicted permease
MLARLRSIVRAVLGRARFEAHLADELQFHVESRVEHLVSEGRAPDEARRCARLEFGAIERVREECREATGLRWLDAARRNGRFAFRLLRRDPVFACATVLTLGLSIGANTAVLSLVDAVLFRPLPYPDPSRLTQVVVAFEHAGSSGEQFSQTGRVWEAVQDHASMLQPAVYSDWVTEVNLAASGRVDRVRQQRVSAGFFGVLGVAPLVGREFTAGEDRPGGPPVVVLSYGLWQRLFDGDPSAVGRRVFLRGEPHTVVGVMPAHFQSGGRADAWTPLRPTTSGEGGGSNFDVIARLRPGASLTRADAQLGGISQDVLREVDLPSGARARLHLVPLQRGWAEDARTPLLLLWGAVGLVLLIGCSNVASLLLARGVRRTRELATRIALGGGQGAVVAQLLTESLLLAALGGVAGVAIGWGLLAAIGPAVAEQLGVWQHVGIDLRVLGATVGLAALTSMLVGLFPALRSARVDVCAALVDGGGRSVAGTRHPWPRRLLVVAEVALGLALAVAAGLLVRTFAHLNGQPAGFDPRGVLTAEVSLQDARYQSAAAVGRLFRDSLDRIGRLPGVEGAGVILTLPYERALNLDFRVANGRPEAEASNVCYVTPGVFGALRMVLLRGRWLTETDRTGSAPVVLVSESFSRRYLPRSGAVGDHLLLAGAAREVVGVVLDVPHESGWGDFGPLAPVPTVYLPVSQLPDGFFPLVHTWFSPRWVVRTTLAPLRWSRGCSARWRVPIRYSP